MEKRLHLYVSRKHPALWLACLLMLASVITRIIVYGRLEDIGVCRQIVLPAFAVVLFILMAFFAGEEMLYRTAVPVWLLGICEIWQLFFSLSGRPLLLFQITRRLPSRTETVASVPVKWLLTPRGNPELRTPSFRG